MTADKDDAEAIEVAAEKSAGDKGWTLETCQIFQHEAFIEGFKAGVAWRDANHEDKVKTFIQEIDLIMRNPKYSSQLALTSWAKALIESLKKRIAYCDEWLLKQV